MNEEVDRQSGGEQEWPDREQVEEEPFQSFHSQLLSAVLVGHKVSAEGEQREPAEQIGIGDQCARPKEPEPEKENEDPESHQIPGPGAFRSVFIHFALLTPEPIRPVVTAGKQFSLLHPPDKISCGLLHGTV